MTNEVKATTVLELFREGVQLNKREVQITFHPPYNENEHGNLTPKLKKLLQKPKVSVFNITEEPTAILELLKSEHVNSVKWV